MVVNDILRFGFAHIQRTAGGSMTAALMRLPGSRRVFPDHAMRIPPGTRAVAAHVADPERWDRARGAGE